MSKNSELLVSVYPIASAALAEDLMVGFGLTDWNDERGERVATDNSTIVHDVLRSNFPVSKEETLVIATLTRSNEAKRIQARAQLPFRLRAVALTHIPGKGPSCCPWGLRWGQVC